MICFQVSACDLVEEFVNENSYNSEIMMKGALCEELKQPNFMSNG